MKIFIYDAGAFGTAVAAVLARVGHEVTALIQTYDYPHLKMLLCFERTGKNELGKRENNLHLPGVELPDNVVFTDKLEGLTEVDVIFLAVSTPYLGEAFLKTLLYLEQNPKATLVLLSKGFDDFGKLPWGLKMQNRLKLMNFYNFAVISGPTFAHKIVCPYQAHWASVASYNLATIKKLYAAFRGTGLQLLGTTDLAGVSWGGGLKNAYAIGYGLIFKQTGESAAFEYIWLALKEMKVFLDFAGVKPKTLGSPAVQGDFYATCRGDSRNRHFGEELAKYLHPDEILKYVRGGTVEGYEAAKTLWRIAHENKLHAPLLYGIQAISEFGASPSTFVDCFKRVKALSV